MTKLGTVIASDITTINPITTLHLPSFTPLDIKSYLHSSNTQFTNIPYFLPLLNSSQSCVSLSHAKQNLTVDATLYAQLTKTILNLTMQIINQDPTSKSRVEILVLLQAKISMSNSPNDIDTLYKNWCNIAKGEIKPIEDYITRAVQFKEDLYGTKMEIQHPEFIRKWRQRFDEILAPIKLVVDNLSQDHPKRRDYVALFQLMKTSKGYTPTIQPLPKQK